MKQRLFILTLVVIITAATAASAREEGDPFIGKRLYRSFCQVCHNKDGKGKGPLAIQLHLKPVDLTLPKYQKKTVVELADIIAGYKRSEKNPMPRWIVALPQQNIRHIAAYIGRITNKSLRYAGDIRHGKKIFAESCASCHGPKGRGDGVLARVIKAPMVDFSNPKGLRHLSEESLLRVITKGLGDYMPAWEGELSHDQIIDVGAYVQSIRQSDQAR